MTTNLIKRSEIKTVEIICDGGCKGNGQESAQAYGSFVVLVNGKVVHQFANVFDTGVQTNNAAEYKALIDALDYMASDPARKSLKFVVKTDSTLVHGQVVLGNKVKVAHLVPLHAKVKELMSEMNVELIKVPRAVTFTALGH